jgi:hypothetical protein
MDDCVSYTSTLLLIIGVETSLMVGFVCGPWVMGRLAKARRQEDDAQRLRWFSEGRAAECRRASPKVTTLRGRTETRSEDAGRAERHSAV